MRKIVFGLFYFGLCAPAFGKAALPSVRLDSSVSARAAFGEELVTGNRELVAETPITKNEQPKTVVARAAKTQPSTTNIVIPRLDRGIQVNSPSPTAIHTKRGDVLTPSKPANNLWAKNHNDQPLRMPRADEFTVIDSDYELPAERLDPVALPTVVAAKKPTNIPPATIQVAAPLKGGIATNHQHEPPTRTTNTIKREIVPAAQPVQIARAAAIERPASPIPPLKGAAAGVAAGGMLPAEQFAYDKEDDIPFSKLSPAQLKKAFKKTYVSENKHLSAYDIDSKFDSLSDVSVDNRIVGFDSSRDFSEKGGVRPLEIKLGFDGANASLSRDNYNLLSEYAGIVASNPKRAIQISIPERSVRSYDGRKIVAKRLAIVEQVLRDNGISDARIMPVLTDRNDNSFVLRVISNDMYQTLSEKRRDMFGDTISGKSYRSLAW